MLLRVSGVIDGALRLKSPAVENIKAIRRSPTTTFCTGGRAASSRSGGGSNMDSQGKQQQQEPVKTTGDEVKGDQPPARASSATGGSAALRHHSHQSQTAEATASPQRDAMSHSFGEGYSTRSDEEGFGGVYGGNQSISKPGEHENHPDYDKSQGSEVKEKEKGRNQAQRSVK